MILEIALNAGFTFCGIALVAFGVGWLIQAPKNLGPKKAGKTKGGNGR